ncbi:MAG: putative rane protein [Deltaproteobacteria bacterium]|nr:putative rane protein [Deltaproteobacteria bacterium]
MMRSFVGLGIAVAALALGACAQNLVQVRDTGPGSGEALALSRVAIAPFRAMPRAGAATLPTDATALVASYVAEGFGARGIDTVPSSDVASALGSAEPGVDLRAALAVAREKFGADALVTGSVYRFRNRDGEAMGSVNPSSVGFDVKVYRAGDGKLLWSGVFDHTQVALGENALTAARYPGGGTRWMTSEELAHWGALKLVQEVPLAAK